MQPYTQQRHGKPTQIRPWTQAELKRLAELVQLSLATPAIGQQLGRTARSVWDAMIRYNITFPADVPRYYQRRRDGKVIQTGTGKPWTAEETKTLTDMVSEGRTVTDITAQLPGRSLQSVKHRRRRLRQHLGIPPGRPGRRPGSTSRPAGPFDTNDTDEL